MRIKWLYAAGLMLGAAGLAWAAPPGSAKQGKAVYDQSCKNCHGVNGEGNESLAKMMHTKILPLGSKEVQAKSDAELKKDITTGVGKMPAVKNLSDKQVDDVIAYIREMGKSSKK